MLYILLLASGGSEQEFFSLEADESDCGFLQYVKHYVFNDYLVSDDRS